MSGLSATGFEKKIFEDIRSEIESALKTSLGNGINTVPPSIFGTIINIFAEREALLWDLAEAVYFSQYPNTAVGVALDGVVALTAITRLQATPTRQLGELLFGTPGTLVPAGTVYSVDGNPNAKFSQDNDVTLVAGNDEVQHIAFSAVPDGGNFKLQYEDQITSILPFNATNTQIQNALNALGKLSGMIVTGNFTAGFDITFGGDDGKQDQPMLLVTDNNLVIGITPIVVTITQTTQGQPQGEVNLTAIDPGETQALEGTLIVIDNPISGLDRVHNPVDAIIGRNTETDNELRLRRDLTLQVAGAATLDAIRSRLLNLEGVTSVLPFENKTLVTDIDGRPGKSYEMVVQGGVPQNITQTIWDSKPAGIETFGNQTGTAIDSQGVGQMVKWSRPTGVDIWVTVDIETNLNFPVDGADLVEQAIIDYINGLGIGSDVIVYPGLICAIAVVPGIINIIPRVGTAPSPTLDDNIDIAPAEIAQTDSGKVIVNLI